MSKPVSRLRKFYADYLKDQRDMAAWQAEIAEVTTLIAVTEAYIASDECWPTMPHPGGLTGRVQGGATQDAIMAAIESHAQNQREVRRTELSALKTRLFAAETELAALESVTKICSRILDDLPECGNRTARIPGKDFLDMTLRQGRSMQSIATEHNVQYTTVYGWFSDMAAFVCNELDRQKPRVPCATLTA